MLISACCGCETGTCDLHSDTFATADLSAYTSTPGSAVFSSGVGAGDLVLNANHSGQLAKANNLVSGLNGLVIFCEVEINTFALPEIRAEALVGCFINSSSPVSGGTDSSYVELLFHPYQLRQNLVNSSYHNPEPGIILLTYPGADFYGSVVHWGMISLPKTLRLEIHDVSAGGGTYDILCFVDNLLCHRECDVPLDLDPDDLPAGPFGQFGGRWTRLCIGENYLANTRLCTWTPNQYNIRFGGPDGNTQFTPGVGCFDFEFIDLDTWDLTGPEEDQWVEYWLRKVTPTGNPNVCEYESYSRFEQRTGSSDPNPPLWRLRVTRVATDTYTFRLIWTSASTTVFGEFNSLVWDSAPITPYPTGDVNLGINTDLSTCLVDAEDHEAIVINTAECARIERDGAGTLCCPDRQLPLVLPASITPGFSYPGSLTITDFVFNGSGVWEATITFVGNPMDPTPCDGTELTVTLRCTHFAVEGGGEPPDSFWMLEVEGVETPVVSATCNPFSISQEVSGATCLGLSTIDITE